MPIPQALQGDRWTEKATRHSFPILVAAAERGSTMTYSELDREIVERGLEHHVMFVQYGRVAGAIGDALKALSKQWQLVIPPLNAILVSQADGLPGGGFTPYLKGYYGIIHRGRQYTHAQKRAIVEEIQGDVFAFPHWARVLAECELQATQLDGRIGEPQPALELAQRGWSTEPESEEHQQLKNYVATHPACVGLPRKTPRGQIEYTFASADRADVVFNTGGGRDVLGVEVKSRISNDSDLNRGLFQAIKYQALLRAEQRARGEAPSARAVLVSERVLPESLVALAARLKIVVFVVTPE